MTGGVPIPPGEQPDRALAVETRLVRVDLPAGIRVNGRL